MTLLSRIAMLVGLLLCALSGSTSAQCPDYFVFEDSQYDGPAREAIDGAGDVDNDGRDDVIVGRPDYTTNARRMDSAWVCSSATGALLYPLSSGEGDLVAYGPAVDGVSDISILIDYLFIAGPTLGLPDCMSQ